MKEPENHNVEMIRIEAEQQKAACVAMLPGAIPGADVKLRTLQSGDKYVADPVPCKAFIYLSIDGVFTFSAGTEKRNVSGRCVFIPGAGQRAEFSASVKTRLLEIVWTISKDDLTDWEQPKEQIFPFIQEYLTAPQYRDRNKSDKTVSRKIVRQRIVPGFCMGSVETFGYDKAEQNSHPLLDQFFFSFPENDTDVLIDDFRVPMKGDTLLHIPLGSSHGLEVAEGKRMHYIWMDFFLGQAVLNQLDNSHKEIASGGK